MYIEEFEILFDDLDIDGPTSSQLYEMYGIFLDDFHKNTLIHKGKKVVFNKNFSKHPLFRGKYQGFVHVVTRDNKYNDKRQFDRDRANRMHWIKPILDNWQTNSYPNCLHQTNDPLVSLLLKFGANSAHLCSIASNA